MEEIQRSLTNIINERHAEKVDATPPQKEVMDEDVPADEQKDGDINTPPPEAAPVRKIPEGSTVRRRLFADDDSSEASGTRNMINSVNDIDRMIQEELSRGSERWNFDTESELPTSIGGVAYPEGLCRDNGREEEMMEDADADRLRMEMIRETANKINRLMERSDRRYSDAMGHIDNIANSLMDETQEHYSEGVQHWNFDFDNKMPAEGKVVWQQVGLHWIGNKPGTISRVVLYPMEAEKGENTPDATSQEELNKGKANESGLKPNDLIEHLLTDRVNVIYGDSNKEMPSRLEPTLIASEPQQQLHNIYLRSYSAASLFRLFKVAHQHCQVNKSEALALIRQDIYQDEDADVAEYMELFNMDRGTMQH